MSTIPAELLDALRRAAPGPLRLDDPESQRAYVVIPADEYERFLAAAPPVASPGRDERPSAIDIIRSAPKPLRHRTAAEIDRELDQERSSWDH